MHFKQLGIIACACVALAGAWGEAPQFKAGDRVCFVGDSVTHVGSYHTQILLFYVTRHPEMRIKTWNRGIGGDFAGGCVKRYSWDVAPCMPTVCTISVGGNDVNRPLYGADKSGKEVEERRQKAINNSIGNMEKFVEQLSKDGVGVIIMTPTLIDETGTQKFDKQPGVNGALKAIAEAERQIAGKYKCGIVEWNAPMEAINKEWQAKDPNFTVVGYDRIHPAPPGYLVMAYLFLKAQGVSPTVAAMEIDAMKGVATKQENCEISKLSASSGKVAFTCLEKALPFPVDDAAAKALELVPFTEDLNQETLKVSGLPEGQYELLIDGASVMKASSEELLVGVNLATVKGTPQLKQAQKAQAIIKERAAVEQKSRIFAEAEHKLLKNLKERSPEGDRKAIEDKLALLKSGTGENPKYYIRLYESYLKQLPEKESLERSADELLDKAYAASLPVPHTFELRPLGK